VSFLCRIDRAVTKPFGIQIVLENHAIHKTPEAQAQLSRHPRFRVHFAPTKASSQNPVARIIEKISAKRIRRRGYSSVDDLDGAIYDYLSPHDSMPLPLVWS